MFQQTSTSKLIQCPICKELSEQPYLNYGAKACYSCRAFFRRAHQKTRTPAFVCKKGNNCEVNVRTRRQCQKCRYDLCLAAGMRPEFVMNDAQKRARFKTSPADEAEENGGAIVAAPGPKKAPKGGKREAKKRQRKESAKSSEASTSSSPSLDFTITFIDEKEGLNLEEASPHQTTAMVDASASTVTVSNEELKLLEELVI